MLLSGRLLRKDIVLVINPLEPISVSGFLGQDCLSFELSPFREKKLLGVEPGAMGMLGK